jgi:hypothetical protein
MNGKIKALITIAFILGIPAVALYVVPTLAYQNGVLDQDYTRDCARNRERDRECICLQDENYTCQNENCRQNCCSYQFQHEEHVEQMNSVQMEGMGAENNNCYRSQERHRIGN